MTAAPSSNKQADIQDERELVASIRSSHGTDTVIRTVLKTDERVIARVTDGIYRQPGSAIRELISNAYDADATRVVIKTDAPRFERIVVEDDGHGMTPEVLAHLLLHIGGSAKRHEDGPALGVTSADPTRSPKGRKLIGKIGIGLFSVSQLTHSFQIITKVKGDDFRTVATVALRQYADEEDHNANNADKRFESGKVNIWREKASDKPSHGTTIVLTSIRPQARDTLRSREIWSVIEQNESQVDMDERQVREPPLYHIGRVDSSNDSLAIQNGQMYSLPWTEQDSPDSAFQKLVHCVWNEVGKSTPNPQLDRIFDYYLRMVWQIALAVPVPYVEGHLFDWDLDGDVPAFLLSNAPKGNAKSIELPKGTTLREHLGLIDPADNPGQFEVLFDGLKLSRPVRFRDLPVTNNALKKPLVMIGKCREEFSGFPKALSGGSLEFEAYLFWTPKVAPTEHQGSLIRIHGSSGTLFDGTFMHYQVSEQNRLRQITCEIFVSEGLDSALNIDRESFNSAHPHSVFITKWLHNALRQLASAQKRLASQVRATTREEGADAVINEISRVATDAWQREHDDEAAFPPAIQLDANSSKLAATGESYVFSRTSIIPKRDKVRTTKSKAADAIQEEKLKGIAQVLASYGLLDKLSKKKQEQLLRAIFEILEASVE
ncbi:ATP-binding protein [Herbaspirillum sp. SJZ099]|uniref:ATP-binding protein n=1 Tax=Herbaspirillum sp. SJZ099 TaxID=2572916 RepID=UPI0011A87EA3|nr:ATP-binding protein [Herbaspirillum sp. SJZ099]TWC72006.1 histidine kinase/DNA gyrase B/HSP90-like ATPase [Herbaspirillum sp. SJZ099]